MYFYGGSRLPFARPGNSPNASVQLAGATQAAADLSCSLNKALTPWQCPFMEVQGCRLPGLETPQTLPCSSQAPLRPRQTFPAASNKALRPWQCPFMEVQRLPFARPGNSPNPPVQLATADLSCSSNKAVASLQLPGHSGRGRPFLQLTRP